MKNQLSTETHVMVVTGFGRVYLSESQAKVVRLAMVDPNTANVEIPNKGIFRVASIHGVSPASQLDLVDKTKQGDWQCKLRSWHQRGHQCACVEAQRLGLPLQQTAGGTAT